MRRTKMLARTAAKCQERNQRENERILRDISRQPGMEHDGHGRSERAGQGPLRGWRNPALGPCAGADARLGDPPRAPWRSRHRDAGRGRRDPRDRQPRGAGPGDGGGGQLQRRLGRTRHPDLAFRHPQGALPHRRLRRLRHRLEGRRQGQALAGRRRGGDPLQPGRRRRRAMQRRRPDVLALAADLGLRDPGRLVRPVHPGPGPATDAPPPAPDLGGERLLHPDPGHRLPDAVRPPPAYPAPGPQRAGVGRLGGLVLVRDPAHQHRRGQCHRGDLGRGQARLRAGAWRQGGDQPQGFQLLGPAPHRQHR